MGIHSIIIHQNNCEYTPIGDLRSLSLPLSLPLSLDTESASSYDYFLRWMLY